MKHYRAYMDRAALSGEAHERLMDRLQEAEDPTPRRMKRQLSRWAAAAACCALVCLTLFGVWRGVNGAGTAAPQLSNDAPPGVKDTYGPGEVTPDGQVMPVETTDPAQADGDPYVLRPEGPFQEGEVHSNFALISVEYDSLPEIAASIAMPKGWFEEPLTREQMAAMLAGADGSAVPWTLSWDGYDVTGRAVYDGMGNLWRVELSGVSREDGRNSFSLTAKPGGVPEDCAVDVNQKSTEINGIQVFGSNSGRYGWDDSGALGYVYKIVLLAGNVGVRFQASNMDEEQAAMLADAAANTFARADGALCLDGLLTWGGDIPEWRSESLTLDEAWAEPELGLHVPSDIPDGFTFGGASRELGQNRDYLSLWWEGYYTHISITIQRPFEEAAVMDTDDKKYYDQRLYTIPYCDSVPDEVMFGGFQDPVFRYEDLTLDVIEARLTYADSDAGDISGYRGNFTVLYPDGLVARYSVKGVTPAEMAQMLGLGPEMCEGLPVPTP